jgi:hypothetical protein
VCEHRMTLPNFCKLRFVLNLSHLSCTCIRTQIYIGNYIVIDLCVKGTLRYLSQLLFVLILNIDRILENPICQNFTPKGIELSEFVKLKWLLLLSGIYVYLLHYSGGTFVTFLF